ncbi:hypothetical protein [Kribbella sp. NPDC000426]|uniref:hypothetical protein n=1 Tax=Kribbella sp. NPDC000426 TaxID=3154255 RepID=UPI0033200107
MSPVALADGVLTGELSLTGQVRDFLADCEFSGEAAHTIRAYRGVLVGLDRRPRGVDEGPQAGERRGVLPLGDPPRARRGEPDGSL